MIGRITRATQRDERGATLVEFSLILPLLLLVMIGIMELGMAFRDVLTTSSAVREGTRMLSALGNDPEADCTALIASVETLLTAGTISNLDRIEIYKADASGNQSANPNFTNTYTFAGGDHKDCGNWTAVAPWASTGRAVIAGTGYELDIVGMRIVYVHDWVTGFPPFSGEFEIDQTTISRLEPEEYA